MDGAVRNIIDTMANSIPVQNSRKKASRAAMGSFTDDDIAGIRWALSSGPVVEQSVGPQNDENDDHHGEANFSAIAANNSTEANGHPVRETDTYSVVRQKHIGPRHGRGGRKRGPSISERRRTVTPEITKLFARTLIGLCGGSINNVLKAVKESFTSLHPEYFWKADTERFFIDLMTDLGTGHAKSMYEVFPAPYFAVCIKLPYSQTGTSSLFPMDRHAICTWLGEGGQPFCTCVGSTSFRISLQGNFSAQSGGVRPRDAGFCAHVIGISALIEKMRLCLGTPFTLMANALTDLYARRYITPLATYIYTRPRLTLVHEDTVAVISEMAPGTTRTVQFTPVRIFQKGSGGYVCAFCDTVLKAGCQHTKVVRKLRKENEPDDDIIEENDNCEDYSDEEDDLHDEEDITEETQTVEDANSEPDHKSCFPLSPVNCSRSLRIDRAVGDCATRGQPFVLAAPLTCSYCKSHRNPKTRRVYEGIIMCTLGPCIFQSELYNCSSGECGRPIETEGREHCVLIDKCTAATHVLLRRELIGVVMNNGTLNGRLRQYHSDVTSLIEAKIISAYPPCRSVRSLHRLCTIMLKLMVQNPDKDLFLCSKCDGNEDDGRKRQAALCIDGINQGYLRSKQVSLQNISQPCSSVPASNAAFHGNSCRPLNTLIRRRQTVSVILDAIQGNSITVDERNVTDIAAVIRIVSAEVIPPQFCSHSVCGRTFNDFYDDIGKKPILSALRKVTNSLFHADTILYRVMKPLDAFIKRCVSDNSLE